MVYLCHKHNKRRSVISHNKPIQNSEFRSFYEVKSALFPHLFSLFLCVEASLVSRDGLKGVCPWCWKASSVTEQWAPIPAHPSLIVSGPWGPDRQGPCSYLSCSETDHYCSHGGLYSPPEKHPDHLSIKKSLLCLFTLRHCIFSPFCIEGFCCFKQQTESVLFFIFYFSFGFVLIKRILI